MSDDLRATSALFSRARLRQARQLKGFTRAEVARQCNISAAAVSQYESGATRPRPATLAQLALVLGVPASFLSEPKTEPAVLPAAQESFFRSVRSTSQRERERAAAHAGLLAQLVAEVERHVELPAFERPADLELDPEETAERAEHAAIAVRERWDLGGGPVHDVVRVMEQRGVVVARLAFEERVDAFSWAAGPRPLVILGSTKKAYERSRFDAAHELGHLIMHASDAEPANASMERQAHRFSGAFLVPAETLREEWPSGRVDWARLLQLKERWGLSVAALLYRGKDIGILTPATYTNAMKYLSRKWGRRQEPGPVYHLEEPRLLNKALGLLEANGLTLEDLADRARLTSADDLRAALQLRPLKPLRLDDV